MVVYEYVNCGTCKKALAFLSKHNIPYTKKPIRETPPTEKELGQMLKEVKEVRRLFNTSGKDYREMNLKEKIPKMDTPEILKLLASNGNLIKRPFVIGEKVNLVGFDEIEWKLKLRIK